MHTKKKQPKTVNEYVSKQKCKYISSETKQNKTKQNKTKQNKKIRGELSYELYYILILKSFLRDKGSIYFR